MADPRLTRPSLKARLFIYLTRKLLPGLSAESLLRNLDFFPYRSMFYFALLQSQYSQLPHTKNEINYYEFGVGWGGTLSAFVSAERAYRTDHGMVGGPRTKFFLFDSFEGLPEKSGWEDDYRGWQKGGFAHGVKEIEGVLDELKVNGADVRLVKGFFEESLTTQLREELRGFPPTVVTIDVDYYSSCKAVLDWIKPILRDGTTLYFDDILEFDGNPNRGEKKAIEEFNKDESVHLERIGRISPISLSDGCFIFSRSRSQSDTAEGVVRGTR